MRSLSSLTKKLFNWQQLRNDLIISLKNLKKCFTLFVYSNLIAIQTFKFTSTPEPEISSVFWPSCNSATRFFFEHLKVNVLICSLAILIFYVQMMLFHNTQFNDQFIIEVIKSLIIWFSNWNLTWTMTSGLVWIPSLRFIGSISPSATSDSFKSLPTM